jgi:hypothetical protein
MCRARPARRVRPGSPIRWRHPGSRPIYLGVGLLDRDVPPQSTLTFYDELVANNQDVTLRVYPDDDHSGTVLASLPDSTPFLANAFAG